MSQERVSRPPQPPIETRMFRDVPMQALSDMLKTLPVPITITQHLDEQREKIFYRYQVGETTPENPVGISMGATPNFLDAVKFSLRPTIPLRLERRARHHSHRQAKGEAHQANPRPDEGVNEAHKEASLGFGEYNGWVNYPSWSVYTIMTSFDEPREQLERMALQQPGGMGNVRRAVLGSIEHWKNDTPTPYAEAACTLVQDFLMSGVRRVEWTPVSDTLQGERKELGEANELTTLAYQLLAGADWQSIVKDAPQADDLLRGWLEDQCLTWIESPDARHSQQG